MKRMKRRRGISLDTASIVLVLVLILASAATIFVYSFIYIEEVMVFPVKLEVGYKVGLNADADAVKFGIVPPGGSGARFVRVSNNGAEPARVDVKFYGKMTNWLRVSEESFVLEPGEEKRLSVAVYPPQNADYGNYTAKMVLFVKKDWPVRKLTEWV